MFVRQETSANQKNISAFCVWRWNNFGFEAERSWQKNWSNINGSKCKGNEKNNRFEWKWKSRIH